MGVKRFTEQKNFKLFPGPNFGKSTDLPSNECPENDNHNHNARDPEGEYDDVKGIWPENSFEILYGMTGHSHMGRIDWDKHPIIFNADVVDNKSPYVDRVKANRSPAGGRLKGRYYDKEKTNIGQLYGTRYTQGPYPLRGKNDGLLECPSSILNRDFEFHQNVMSVLPRSRFHPIGMARLTPPPFPPWHFIIQVVFHAKNARHLSAKRKCRRRRKRPE